MGFTKLDDAFASSSIFSLGLSVVGFWAYLMSQADSRGVVTATVPDMAARCRVTPEQVEEFLDLLQQPDRWSRTPDNEGRRIAVTREPEWAVILLNHGKYRERDHTAAERQRRHRLSRRDTRDVTPEPVTSRKQKTEAEAEAEAENGRTEVPAPPPPDPRPEHERVRGSNFREASDLEVKILRAVRQISERTERPAWEVCRQVTAYKRKDGTMSAGVEDPSRLGSILARQKALEDATWWLEELEKGATDGKAG